MRTAWLALLMASAVFAETNSPAQEARLAWMERDKPGQTEKAIHLWEQATHAEPAQTDLWIGLAKAMHPELRSLVLGYRQTTWGTTAAYMMLLQGQCYPTEIVERVRLLAWRKRGPKGVRAAQNEQGERAA